MTIDLSTETKDWTLDGNGSLESLSAAYQDVLANIHDLGPNSQYHWDYVATNWCWHKTEYVRTVGAIREKFMRHRGKEAHDLLDSLYAYPDARAVPNFYSTLRQIRHIMKSIQDGGPYLYGDVESHARSIASLHMDPPYGRFVMWVCHSTSIFDLWLRIKQDMSRLGVTVNDPYGLPFVEENIEKLSALHESSKASLRDPVAVSSNVNTL